jgi:hypothetical protein
MAKGKGGGTTHRSAVTGRYTTAKKAAASPNTHVTHKPKPGKPGKKG